MRRRDLKHLIRAAAAITDRRAFVAVGSQAALVSVAALPPSMAVSQDLDLWPEGAPELAIDIEGALGEDSLFHERFGYYAKGVGPETALLPADWRTRAQCLETPGMAGARVTAPALVDLCATKLVALRDKDFVYVAAALAAGLVDRSDLAIRVTAIEHAPQEARDLALAWLRRAGGGTGE